MFNRPPLANIQSINNTIGYNIKKLDSPIYEAITNFFCHPIKSMESFIENYYTFFRKTNNYRIENMKSRVSYFLEIYGFNVYNFIIVCFILLTAICIYSVITKFSSLDKAYQETTKRSYSSFYALVWMFIISFSANKYFLNNDTAFLFEISKMVTSFKTMMCCLVVTVLILSHVYFILAHLPYFCAFLSFIAITMLTYIEVKYNIGLPVVYISIMLSCFILLVSIASIFNQIDTKFIHSFKLALKPVLRNSIYLFPILFIATSFQYLQFSSLGIIWNDVNNTSFTLLIIPFLFASSHYFMSYLNVFFTANTFSSIYVMGENAKAIDLIKNAFDNLLWSIDSITLQSVIIAIFRSFLYLLAFCCNSTNNNSFDVIRTSNPVLGCIVLLLIITLVLLDSRSTLSLISLSINKTKNQINVEDPGKNRPIIVNSFLSVLKPDFLFSFFLTSLFYANYSLFIENYPFLCFPIFLTLNITIYFINSIHISHLVNLSFLPAETYVVRPKTRPNTVNMSMADLQTNEELISIESTVNEGQLISDLIPAMHTSGNGFKIARLLKEVIPAEYEDDSFDSVSADETPNLTLVKTQYIKPNTISSADAKHEQPNVDVTTEEEETMHILKEKYVTRLSYIINDMHANFRKHPSDSLIYLTDEQEIPDSQYMSTEIGSRTESIDSLPENKSSLNETDRLYRNASKSVILNALYRNILFSFLESQKNMFTTMLPDEESNAMNNEVLIGLLFKNARNRKEMQKAYKALRTDIINCLSVFKKIDKN